MFTWPANSWVFWVLVLFAFGLFIRFGIYPRRDEPRPARRMVILAALAAAAVGLTAFLPGLVLSSLLGAGFAGDIIDLTLWSFAALIAAAAFLVACWALFADRSRGRKRCPTCWYDMSGAPSLTCPECGKTAASARGLHRTRRRWRALPLVGLLALLSLATAAAPIARSNDWPRSLPDIALYAILPHTSTTGIIGTEFQRRLYDPDTIATRLEDGQGLNGAVARWSVRKLLRQTPVGLPTDFAVQLIMRSANPEPFIADLSTAAIAGHAGAFDLLTYYAPRDAAIKAVAEQLLTSNKPGFAQRGAVALTKYYGFGSASTQVPSEVQKLLDSPTAEHRAGVLAALYTEPFTPLTESLIDKALTDPAIEVRITAIRLLEFNRPKDPRLHAIILQWLTSGTPQERHLAAWQLVNRQTLDDDLAAALPGALNGLVTQDRDMILENLAIQHNDSDTPGPCLNALIACDAGAASRTGLINAIRYLNTLTLPHIEQLRTLETKWRAEGDTLNADRLDAEIKRRRHITEGAVPASAADTDRPAEPSAP